MAENAPVVADNPAEGRFDVTVDGRYAGSAYYRLAPGSMVFTHTEINPEFEGQGIGSALARGALDEVRQRGGTQVTPLCPFVAAFIRRHQEYLDLVDDKHRAAVESKGS